MNHQEATLLTAVEKYLLDELPAPARHEFEEHFFDCADCAADLRATAAFLDAAKAELKTAPQAQPSSAPAMRAPAGKSWFSFLWSPAFVSPAFAALLLIIAYQNLLVIPRFAGDTARQRNAEILPSLSLAGGNSRGGATPSITVSDAQSFLLSIDIPVNEHYANYVCELVSPAGAVVARLAVPAEQTNDTVFIRIPAARRTSGQYTVTVRGHANRVPEGPGEDLARYHFMLKNQD